MRALLKAAIENTKRDTLNRLKDVHFQLDHIRKAVVDPHCPLNDLGELQGMILVWRPLVTEPMRTTVAIATPRMDCTNVNIERSLTRS